MEITFLPYTQNLGANPEMILTDCAVHPVDDAGDDNIVKALWDTGANCSMISAKLAKAMKLQPCRTLRSHSTNGTTRKAVYDISIMLPNGAGLPVVEVVEGEFFGHDIIIGMDIITLHDFSLTHNRDGELIFSIVFPPLHRPIDYKPLER